MAVPAQIEEKTAILQRSATVAEVESSESKVSNSDSESKEPEEVYEPPSVAFWESFSKMGCDVSP